MKQYISFEFESETIWVEVRTLNSRDQIEEELFDAVMSYALNMTDWQPQELVRDVMNDSAYEYRILTPIEIGIPTTVR